MEIVDNYRLDDISGRINSLRKRIQALKKVMNEANKNTEFFFEKEPINDSYHKTAKV
jgi:hypothetical protein